MTRRRIGPHRDRPHFVIARAFQEAPRLFRVTGQNHVNRRLYGADLATGGKEWLSMDDVLATHDDETEAAACFENLRRHLPAIDGAVWRARRALEDAELTRRRTLREIAIGNALKPDAGMTGSRLPSIADLIRWYADAGMRPVVIIDYAARKVTVRPKADNDTSEASDLEPADALADDIRRAFGEG